MINFPMHRGARVLRGGACLAALTALFTGSACAAVAEPEGSRGGAAPAAAAYLQWAQATLGRVETNLPAIIRAAEAAAEPFLAGRDLGVRGGAGLNEELGARAGGLCVYRATPGKPGDVVLYAFGVATAKEPQADKLVEKELADAEALAAAGSTVIGLASLNQLAALGQLDRARAVCKVLLDNFAPPGDGLFTDAAGKAAIPTFTTANAIVAWTWMAEFFAACTRAGQTPAMYQSVVNDPERIRYAKYLKVRFHDDLKVAPIGAGRLGTAYLDVLRGNFAAVREPSRWQALYEAASRAAQTLRDGGKVFLFARGHYPPRHHAGQLPADPSGFQRLMLPKAGTTSELPAPGAADYGIAVAYSLPPGDPWWSGGDELLRRAGRGVCWIISGHKTKPEHLRANELLVDQCWPDGDAAVKIEGYDVNICPPSGVLSELLMWMVTAETWAQSSAVQPEARP